MSIYVYFEVYVLSRVISEFPVAGNAACVQSSIALLVDVMVGSKMMLLDDGDR
jgi:hypothetical protein